MIQEKTGHKGPSNPFVLSIKDLYRQPGASDFKQLAIQTPEQLQTSMVSVPQGTDLEMDISLESVHEGVFASGTIKTESIQECSRCLEPHNVGISTHFGELFYYPKHVPSDDENEEELDIYEVDDQSIDLEQIMRNEVISQFPFNPVCPDGCGHDTSGYLKAQEDVHDQDSQESRQVDPRWAVLAEFTEGQEK